MIRREPQGSAADGPAAPKLEALLGWTNMHYEPMGLEGLPLDLSGHTAIGRDRSACASDIISWGTLPSAGETYSQDSRALVRESGQRDRSGDLSSGHGCVQRGRRWCVEIDEKVHLRRAAAVRETSEEGEVSTDYCCPVIGGCNLSHSVPRRVEEYMYISIDISHDPSSENERLYSGHR